MQLLDAREYLLQPPQPGGTLTGGHQGRGLPDQVVLVGQELVQRRVDESDHNGQSRHRLEDPHEVAALHRQQPCKVFLTLAGGGGHDHRLHDRETVLLHEHVLGAAEPDALRAVLARLDRIARVVRVRPHLQAPQLVCPAQEDPRRRMLAEGLRIDGGDPADVDVARGAVDRDVLALLDSRAVD